MVTHLSLSRRLPKGLYSNPHHVPQSGALSESRETARLKAVLQTPHSALRTSLKSSPRSTVRCPFRISGNCPPEGGTPNSALPIPHSALRIPHFPSPSRCLSQPGQGHLIVKDGLGKRRPLSCKGTHCICHFDDLSLARAVSLYGSIEITLSFLDRYSDTLYSGSRRLGKSARCIELLGECPQCLGPLRLGYSHFET